MVLSNGEMWTRKYNVRVYKDKKLIYHRNTSNLTSEGRSIEVTYFCTYLVEEQRNRRVTNEPSQLIFYHQIYPWNT